MKNFQVKLCPDNFYLISCRAGEHLNALTRASTPAELTLLHSRLKKTKGETLKMHLLLLRIKQSPAVDLWF